MTYLWVLFIVLHVISIAFAFLSFQRLYYYIRRYRFDESKYTLLFGFVHLHWISAIYIVFVTVWIFGSYFLFTRI